MKQNNTKIIKINDSKLLDLLSCNNQAIIENPINKIEIFDYENNSCGFCHYYYTVIDNNQILILESKVDNVEFICDFKLFVERVFSILNISQFDTIKIFALHKKTVCQYSATQQFITTLLPIKTSNKIKQIINNLTKDKYFYRYNVICYLHKTRKHNSRELRFNEN